MNVARHHPPGFQAGVAERLERSGRSAEAVAALLDLDQGLFLWHRAVARGEGIGALLAELDAGLEVAEFQALTAVARIAHGVGRPAPEDPTVGALAQEMGIDPSRASRLAGQLIAAGYLRREVAQGDARKAILAPTARAQEVMARVRDLKWDRYLSIFADWSDEDIASLSRLMRRYMEGTRRAYARAGSGAAGRAAPPPAAE